MFRTKPQNAPDEPQTIEIPCFTDDCLATGCSNGIAIIILTVVELEKPVSLEVGQLIDIEFLGKDKNMYFSATVRFPINTTRLPVRKRRFRKGTADFYVNTVPWQTKYAIEFTDLKQCSDVLKDIVPEPIGTIEFKG